MGSTKELCDWGKGGIDARFGLLLSIVREPRYVCRKCARVANQDRWLCKPTRIPAESSRASEKPAAPSEPTGSAGPT